MIGEGRADDPRQWVQAAYLVLDAIEDGALSGLGKLPTQEEIAAEMGVHRATVRHAYRNWQNWASSTGCPDSATSP
jgi:DNA-binding GntR family transcriptional regulator